MSEPTQQCDNCHKLLPQSKMATHFGYCRRNVKKCQQCGEMYDINFQEQHQEQFHKKENCNYCKKEFPSGQIQKHKNSCNLKPKFCQYCQQNVPVNEYSSHLKMCQARTKVCEKCRKDIKNIEYLYHITTCPGVIQQPKVITKQKQMIKPSQDYRRQYKRQQQYKGVKVYSRQAKDAKGSKKQIPLSRQQYQYKQNNKNYVPISYQHHPIKTNQRKQTYGRPNIPTRNIQPQYKQQIKHRQYGIKRQNNVQIQDPKVKIGINGNWQNNIKSKNIPQNQKYEVKHQNQQRNVYEQKVVKNERLLDYLNDKPQNSNKYQHSQNLNRDQGYHHQVYSNQIPKPPANQYEKHKQIQPSYQFRDYHPTSGSSRGAYTNQPQTIKIEDKRPLYSGNHASQNGKINSNSANNIKQIQNKYLNQKIENVHSSRNQRPSRRQQNKQYRQSQVNINNNYHNDYLEGQDAQLQKVIMMSMGINNENKSRDANKSSKPSNSYKNQIDIAKQFGDIDMNSSFYRDLQMQQAYQEQIKNNRKR